MMSSASTAGTSLHYHVECRDCARTVQSTLTRLAGVEAHQINFTTQILSLTLDEAKLSRERLKQTLRLLRFRPPAQ